MDLLFLVLLFLKGYERELIKSSKKIIPNGEMSGLQVGRSFGSRGSSCSPGNDDMVVTSIPQARTGAVYQLGTQGGGTSPVQWESSYVMAQPSHFGLFSSSWAVDCWELLP